MIAHIVTIYYLYYVTFIDINKICALIKILTLPGVKVSQYSFIRVFLLMALDYLPCFE